MRVCLVLLELGLCVSMLFNTLEDSCGFQLADVPVRSEYIGGVICGSLNQSLSPLLHISCNHVSTQDPGMKKEIINFFMELMRSNPYCMLFKSLKDRDDLVECNIMIRCDPNPDRRVYNVLAVDQVAAIWNESSEPSKERPRDIRVDLNYV